ncbi:MAG: hypothetical protein US57_C0006G0089 [Candidatus Moranbacteria bacterium GW2011_GWC2_37_73]|nr:MAG: hypothetical protein UR95_C0007G0092 [Parcubacteria group bacterium GW2011_GWC1_36_108]KKQ00119.1 MAG: hypothetical protein US09_C0020G0001 [Candidatus Moranbacteria bacterium GW2011_GWD1_36_198]KKQ01290.1 MAG: hypothetical protein US10_C0019G0001 [Candidatus Moranbacteria bacterium GW2011_GWD2_36_198]KKQ40017.1 MAG: hypothetical protein US57_C0006G0089 [Candidatus Moranbacteria bacterium GW2011_GWC2_37_73]
MHHYIRIILEKYFKKQKPPFIGGIAYPFRETRHTVGVRLTFDFIIDNFYNAVNG